MKFATHTAPRRSSVPNDSPVWSVNLNCGASKRMEGEEYFGRLAADLSWMEVPDSEGDAPLVAFVAPAGGSESHEHPPHSSSNASGPTNHLPLITPQCPSMFLQTMVMT